MRLKNVSQTSCLLWDNRRVEPGEGVDVDDSAAELLLRRDPETWVSETGAAKKPKEK